MLRLLFATLTLPVVVAMAVSCASRDPYYGDRDTRYRDSTTTTPVGDGVREGVREGVRDTIRK